MAGEAASRPGCIQHLKPDHRMDRSWRQGALGNALHALGCGAGDNLAWLLWAIAGLKLSGLCARLRLPVDLTSRTRSCWPLRSGRPRLI